MKIARWLFWGNLVMAAVNIGLGLSVSTMPLFNMFAASLGVIGAYAVRGRA